MAPRGVDTLMSGEFQNNSEEYFVPAAITDTGCERDLNEDRYAVIESPSGVGWFVCDGMGGASGGELAAQLAIDAIRRELENSPPRPSAVALEAAIAEANRVIILRRQNQAFASMGTTIVGVVFREEEVAVSHVGDSRAYLIRGGNIQQLTRDHTLVQELVDRGEIHPSEALSHPQAHILTRCLGSETVLNTEVKTYWIWETPEGEVQDRLVLCSDGLYSLVAEEELAQIVSELPPQEACVELVELAKSRGGFDNITLAVLPLGGQLREQPPMRQRRARTSGATRGKASAPMTFMELMKTGLFTAVLTFFSILVVVLLVVYSIGK